MAWHTAPNSVARWRQDHHRAQPVAALAVVSGDAQGESNLVDYDTGLERTQAVRQIQIRIEG
jgi:hypothetical protein